MRPSVNTVLGKHDNERLHGESAQVGERSECMRLYRRIYTCIHTNASKKLWFVNIVVVSDTDQIQTIIDLTLIL